MILILIIIMAMSDINPPASPPPTYKNEFVIADPGQGSPTIQYEHWNRYVSKYKNAAVSASLSSGVPASIMLAQGILEGDAGRSVLASEAHNHFGVKCRHDCKRPGHCIEFADDNDNDRFIRFKTDVGAFKRQALLLTTNRYTPLCGRCGSDYSKWAIELEELGYATTNAYAEMITNIIKAAHLYEYDNYAARESLDPACARAINNPGNWNPSR